MFLFICRENTNLHSKPVSLCTLESVGELEAVHLQQVKEGISHHVRYAVFRLHQTTVKPVNMYQKKSIFFLNTVNQLIRTGGYLVKVMNPYLLSQSQ